VEIVDRTFRYFDGVYRGVSAGDPASHPALAVEIVGPHEVGGLPHPGAHHPLDLERHGVRRRGGLPVDLDRGSPGVPVFKNSLQDLGPYQSVNLVPDVSGLEDQEAARKAARAYVQPFRDAVARALDETRVEDRDRRELLRGLIRPDQEDTAL